VAANRKENMELDLGDRWNHTVAVFHEGERRVRRPRPTTDRTRRMSVQLGIARLISGALATAWFGVMAHQLTVRQFGQVALVLSLGSLVSVGTDLGIPLALSKVACDHEQLDRQAVWRAVMTRVAAGLVAGTVLIVLWVNSSGTARWWLAGMYSLSVVFTPVGGSFLAMLRGRAVGIVEAITSVISKAALLGVGLLSLAAGWKPAGVIAAFVTVDVLSSLALPSVVGRRLELVATSDPAQRAQLALRATLPLAAAGILGSAYERVDIWLLAVLKGSASVATYVAGYKLYDAALLPATAIAAGAVAAAGPNLSARAQSAARTLAIRSLIVTAPIALAVALISRLLLGSAFGGHYRSASGAVAILMVATLPGAALAVITPIALFSQRAAVMKWTGVGLVGNVVANIVLVPTLGISGAAAAYLVTETVLLVAFFAVLRRAPQAAVKPAT
jgi:O-antigen/teichoic acid export membrane protein